MVIDKNKKILIVGLGLLGGSYAKALTDKGYEVYTITKEQRGIDYALAHGMIKAGTTEIDKEMIAAADITVFALYPHFCGMDKGKRQIFQARRYNNGRYRC